MVSSLHGFIIYWIEIFENHEKVTEVVDVENWRIDNSQVLRWVVSLIKRNSPVSSTKSSIQSTFRLSNYGVLREVMLKGTHFGASTKSSRKSTDLTANTPYYSRPILHIKTLMNQKTIIWDNKDVHDLGSVETEFPAIVFNDTLISEATLSCEPTVSSLNNDEIDVTISFDESDNEDCIVIFDKNSFSYKIISVNNLKTNSENDNDKVNMPLLPSPKPTVSYFDDLDFFKDFENEFPAIVYNDAQTSKSDLLTEPILNPQHIDEFNLKDETSLSECDEEEQNVLNFNDLFPFNVIYPDELKTDTDNDNDKVDIEHSSGDLSVKPLPDVINTDVGAYAHGSNKLLETRPHERISTNIGDVSGDLEVLES
ncbi:hypothetical protein Tco_1033290 [Tanacetum coccineum]|uniref:Uncharacterized protein n=1 Tax=Tanacetum coccineum TaxID=301880 RepID=A0ABQ5GEG7_9ASTR